MAGISVDGWRLARRDGTGVCRGTARGRNVTFIFAQTTRTRLQRIRSIRNCVRFVYFRRESCEKHSPSEITRSAILVARHKHRGVKVSRMCVVYICIAAPAITQRELSIAFYLITLTYRLASRNRGAPRIRREIAYPWSTLDSARSAPVDAEERRKTFISTDLELPVLCKKLFVLLARPPISRPLASTSANIPFKRLPRPNSRA